jgi:hypothetical protein
MAGTLSVPAADTAPAAMFKHSARAFWAVFVLVSVSVATLEVKFADVSVAIPTKACSIAVPRLVLVVVPHEPDCSPVVISSNLRLEKVLAIWYSSELLVVYNIP